MSQEFIGSVDASGGRFAIVVARFNRAVTGALLDGATEALIEKGADPESIDVFHVPGAFEITVAAEACARRGHYDAILCLGAVVRGETPHFDYISREVSRGVNDISSRHCVAIAFGVLTTDTMEQALARAGAGHGNKGYDAAVTALEMVGLLRTIESRE
ncbi:MAG: 6,7-dimethyl-8-ribityllumazine synthase [Deltaproteobacteria bacterium]